MTEKLKGHYDNREEVGILGGGGSALALSCWKFGEVGRGDLDYVNLDRSKIPTPPYFIHEPNEPIIYFTLESTQASNGQNLDYLKERTLRCKAEGNPAPVYKWKKNGKPFNLNMYSNRVAQVPGEGSFVFSKLTVADEGVYQCEATNDNGTAVSEKITLQQTWIRYFPQAEPEVVRVELGDAYQRNCTPPESNPAARVYWIFKVSVVFFSPLTYRGKHSAADRQLAEFHSIGYSLQQHQNSVCWGRKPEVVRVVI
uniref:Ig-like domain-containing protein n=1 Tax=Ascaris lumbricoides TaxID=6252 RepID=A0A9J2PB91_ASCLU